MSRFLKVQVLATFIADQYAGSGNLTGMVFSGFGGILDIVDSPLAAAPFAYLFFMFSGK